MMDEPEEPALDKRLIDWLRALYPPRCIGADETPERAHRYAGKVELVKQLADVHKRQNEPEDLD